ncbi:hypothetical protein D3C72_1520820 [compost metagenome]
MFRADVRRASTLSGVISDFTPAGAHSPSARWNSSSSTRLKSTRAFASSMTIIFTGLRRSRSRQRRSSDTKDGMKKEPPSFFVAVFSMARSNVMSQAMPRVFCSIPAERPMMGPKNGEPWSVFMPLQISRNSISGIDPSVSMQKWSSSPRIRPLSFFPDPCQSRAKRSSNACVRALVAS